MLGKMGSLKGCDHCFEGVFIRREIKNQIKLYLLLLQSGNCEVKQDTKCS